MSDGDRRDRDADGDASGGTDGGDGDDRTDPIIGGEDAVREAAPDSATEAADEVTHSVLAVERTVLVTSVVVTVLLLGFLAYSAATTPETAPPSVGVVGTTPTGNGTVDVRVALTNHGGTGLETATVAVECGDVSTEMEFVEVPASNTATAVVVCPADAERSVTVRSWKVA